MIASSLVVIYLKGIFEPLNLTFLIIDQFQPFFFFHLDIHWIFQIWYRTLPKMTIWTIKSNFLVYLPISTNFFPFTWILIGDYKSDIVVYLEWLSEPLNSTSLLMDWFQQKNFFHKENHLSIYLTDYLSI